MHNYVNWSVSTRTLHSIVLRRRKTPSDARTRLSVCFIMTPVKPSTALSFHREACAKLLSGSALHGNDSDLDLLVDPPPGTTLFDLGGLQVKRSPRNAKCGGNRPVSDTLKQIALARRTLNVQPADCASEL